MKAKVKDVWYHCGHCGSLFQSDFGLDEDRLCEACHRKPGVGLWPILNTAKPDASAKVASFHKKGEKLQVAVRAPKIQKRRYGAFLWITVIWVVVLLGVVGLRHYFMSSGKESNNLAYVTMAKGGLGDERVAKLREALPECQAALIQYLSAGTPEARNQFVANPIDMAGKMAIFYSKNSFPNVDVKRLKMTTNELIKLGGEWMILTRWKEDVEDGVEFEAVFRNEAEGWKLDWPHFRRYCEMPWQQFLDGLGANEAEFRLLARLASDSKGGRHREQRMELVLSAPEWGQPNLFTAESSVFHVDPKSEEGLLLAAAFDLREDDKTIFGRELEPFDGDGLVRVRVKISREKIGEKNQFKLEELNACHWIDSDDFGIELSEVESSNIISK